ncbi:prolipoprotein diacylglyceryl transferase [Bacillus paranthracis]|uniref:prolipoprotein diacylglyceryl transferase family protein n=1 Tax=Bacillus TaxID=1386 RepID=UPI0022E3B47B|nr:MULTISPECIES: prolipoprotein diacylglyceryl transferase family protein [Bacillus cereus group]MDA1744251.1 prolipoprotein diacylglyceryl transferase [Bacillus cereus group sp. LD121LC]MDK7416894.1 prolipoprotein diacylglyceryl transferase [Bacillus paranthracis]MDK7428085.1 prolipoprotein diacylglyceryl transferase [Bacillus paranthracis]MDK7514446.1 prolipoprotein diacylglyceryl transferase [Bacillus paranthracis]MDK7573645.1 prolipoprotein diacylglyceryl transferase [Bacillus paranthracis
MEWIVRLQPVSLIIGSLFGFMLMKRKMKNESVPYEKMMDAVTNAFLIIVFVWKFAPAILNPVWAIRSPLQALLAIGSTKHIVVGCIIASVYIVSKSKKGQFSLRTLLDALPIALCMSIIFYFLFHQKVGVQTTLPWGVKVYESNFLYHPIFIYEIILALCIVGLLWMKNERLGNRKNISVFLIIEGFAHIIISLVSEQNSVLFGLSMQQILSFCVMSLGILFVPKR